MSQSNRKSAGYSKDIALAAFILLAGAILFGFLGLGGHWAWAALVGYLMLSPGYFLVFLIGESITKKTREANNKIEMFVVRK